MLRIDWNPDRKKLRQFGLTILFGLSVIGLLIGWNSGSFSGETDWQVPVVIWGVGGLVGALAWLAPVAVRPLYLVWMGLAFPVGWILSHLFLVIVYYGIFSAVGGFFRLLGRDTLRRRRTSRSTYWKEKRTENQAVRYFRQF
jgi:hypothetical protein